MSCTEPGKPWPPCLCTAAMSYGCLQSKGFTENKAGSHMRDYVHFAKLIGETREEVEGLMQATEVEPDEATLQYLQE